MVRWNAGTEHVKTQRLIDSVHLTLAPVLLGQGRAAVARSGPACARILRNRSQGFGIRDALCAGESYNTELTTKADETKVKRHRNLGAPVRLFPLTQANRFRFLRTPSVVRSRPFSSHSGRIL
jgi:hypothetical protein